MRGDVVTVADALTLVPIAGWPRVEEDGVVHVMYGYARASGVWHYWCGAMFTRDAYAIETTDEYVTCVACAAREEAEGGLNPIAGIHLGSRA